MRTWGQQGLGKTLDIQCQKRIINLSSGRPRAISNIDFFAPCQIDVANKQLFSPLIWNDLLSKTTLSKSYKIKTDKNLDVKEIHLSESQYNTLTQYFV